MFFCHFLVKNNKGIAVAIIKNNRNFSNINDFKSNYRPCKINILWNTNNQLYTNSSNWIRQFLASEIFVLNKNNLLSEWNNATPGLFYALRFNTLNHFLLLYLYVKDQCKKKAWTPFIFRKQCIVNFFIKWLLQV